MARRQALKSADAALSDRHASTIALVVANFAGRRAALAAIVEPSARAAAAQQLANEETAELARLALQHAAEKRAQRQSITAPLAARHRVERRALRQRLRRQRVVVAVQLQTLRPRPAAARMSNGLGHRRSKALPAGLRNWRSQ